MIATGLEIVFSTKRRLDAQRGHRNGGGLRRREPRPTDYIVEIVGAVRDPRIDESIGRVFARRVELSRAAKEGCVSLLEIFDAEQTLFECFAGLYDPETCLPRDRAAAASAERRDLLVIDLVQIDAVRRGRQLGIAALLETIDVWGGGCDYVCIDCAPVPGGDEEAEAGDP